MEGVVALLIPIICGGILPILAIYFGVRQKMNETNQRSQVVIAALEKNPNIERKNC